MQGLPFILDTAASHKSVGAVLLEVQDEKELVIAYISKLMNKHEELYCVTRKELAIQVIQASWALYPFVNGQYYKEQTMLLYHVLETLRNQQDKQLDG